MKRIMQRAEFVVDWDGTCVEEVWPGMGDWLPGAVDALWTLSGLGVTVIYSLRCHEYEMDDDTPRCPNAVANEIMAIRAKLDAAGLVDIRVYPNNRGKPPGKYYIDDRAIRFEGDWHEVLAKIAVDRAKDNAAYLPLHRNTGRAGAAEGQSERVVDITGPIRVFATGATRDADDDKLDYEGFFSPHVLRRRAEYMHAHRVHVDGSLRASDNWQKGIPVEQYMKSLARHFMEAWIAHRECDGEALVEALCGVSFNTEGCLFELLRERSEAA